MNRWFDKESGSALIWVVVSLMVLIGFTGMAIDLGYMVWVGQKLQIGADAAALAAAAHVKHSVTEARTAAHDTAYANDAAKAYIQLALNEANNVDGDIVVGRFNRETGVFDPDATAFNAVKVVARRTTDSLGGPVDLLFGPAFGVNTADVSRTAIAMVSGGTGGGLIVLAPEGRCALDIEGAVTVTVDGGTVHVNSADDCAACIQGNTFVDADQITTVGTVCLTGQPDMPPEIYRVEEPLPDPLADLPPPTWDPVLDLSPFDPVNLTGGEILTISPGYYPNGIYANNGILTLLPGIYILDGEGLNISGNTTFIANNVMIYITGTGAVDITGTGAVTMTPPDPDAVCDPGVTCHFDGEAIYEGVTIFQARDNTNEGRIIGTSLFNLEGTYYFPVNHMELGGDATKFGNQLIVWTMYIHGNGELTINYEGNIVAPGNCVYLVM